jgi:hypothetical protein
MKAVKPSRLIPLPGLTVWKKLRAVRGDDRRNEWLFINMPSACI